MAFESATDGGSPTEEHRDHGCDPQHAEAKAGERPRPGSKGHCRSADGRHGDQTDLHPTQTSMPCAEPQTELITEQDDSENERARPADDVGVECERVRAKEVSVPADQKVVIKIRRKVVDEANDDTDCHFKNQHGDGAAKYGDGKTAVWDCPGGHVIIVEPVPGR